MSVEDDIALVAEQERRLALKGFDERDALAVGDAIRQLAEAAGEALAIDIRLWNRQLYFYAMPGTSADNVDWMRRKSNCVRRWDRASYAMTLRLQAQRAAASRRTPMSTMRNMPRMAVPSRSASRGWASSGRSPSPACRAGAIMAMW